MPRSDMCCVRIDKGEKNRLSAVVASVKQRHPLADKSDVIRDLMGFTDHHLVTEEERRSLLPPQQDAQKFTAADRLERARGGTKKGKTLK
jgi:hypothetical protein